MLILSRLSVKMKPVLIFSHVERQPPGYYISRVLEHLQMPYEEVCLLCNPEQVIDLDDAAAVVFMGGAGNVNDPTPFMECEMEVIHQAYQRDIPILGICLGAQMMSRTLGGQVWEADALEVGWHEVKVLPTARELPVLATLPDRFTVFQWHAHVFSPPPGGQSILTSQSTECQGYVLGKHMALQFHLEMTENIIKSLIDLFPGDLAEPSPYVNSVEEITGQIGQKCEHTFAIAEILFGNWFRQVHESQAD